MDGEIRQVVDNLTRYPAHNLETVTFRQAVDWWKVIYMAELGELTNAEVLYMNRRWAHMIDAIATREGVPVGFLSYSLAELATSEIQLAATAAREAQRALFTDEEE